MAKQETYVSVDIEADGPIPGDNSMLNFGLAAFELDNREPIATYEANLKPLDGAWQDKDTMAWLARPTPDRGAHVVLHLHEMLEGVPTVPYAPPGTDRDNWRDLPKGAFNIEGHGFVARLNFDGTISKE